MHIHYKRDFPKNLPATTIQEKTVANEQEELPAKNKNNNAKTKKHLQISNGDPGEDSS